MQPISFWPRLTLKSTSNRFRLSPSLFTSHIYNIWAIVIETTSRRACFVNLNERNCHLHADKRENRKENRKSTGLSRRIKTKITASLDFYPREIHRYLDCWVMNDIQETIYRGTSSFDKFTITRVICVINAKQRTNSRFYPYLPNGRTSILFFLFFFLFYFNPLERSQ